MRMRVVQAANTSDYDEIEGRSCIEYWRNIVNHADSYCRATNSEGTGDDPIVGGHVIGIGNDGPHVYITPILKSVNSSENPIFFVVDENDLVRVPEENERDILADNDNRHWVNCLNELNRQDEINHGARFY